MLPESVREYWEVYGGWRALFSSPYFILAEAATNILVYSAGPCNGLFDKWAGVAVGVASSMLAFSLGTLTIFMTISDKETLNELRDGGARDSAFMNIVFTLFHFIVVQVVALVFSMLSIGLPIALFVVASMLATFYSVFCALAAAVVILGVGRLKNVIG